MVLLAVLRESALTEAGNSVLKRQAYLTEPVLTLRAKLGIICLHGYNRNSALA